MDNNQPKANQNNNPQQKPIITENKAGSARVDVRPADTAKSSVA